MSSWANFDLDEVFAYHTAKCVKMLDRRLGMIYYSINILVLWYMVGYAMLASEGYLETEFAIGQTHGLVKGSTFSIDLGIAKIWDSVDVVKPARENDAMFVATRIISTTRQTQGNCTNPTSKCSRDIDCRKSPPLFSGKCESGFCEEHQWCPSETENDPTISAISNLETIPDWTLQLRAAIQFPGLQKGRVFSTINTGVKVVPYPEKGANQFVLSDLFNLAGTNYDNVKATGCILSVMAFWVCDMDDEAECQPEIIVERLDTSEKNKGFNYKHAEYFRDADGEPHRDQYTFTGVRLILQSIGIGKKFSLAMVVMQMGSAIALCKIAAFSADFLLLFIMPERDHYRSFKEERTPDFSDVRDKIAEVEAEAKRLKAIKDRFPIEDEDSDEDD